MTVPASSAAWLEARDLPPVLERVRPLTMVPEESLVDLARQVRTVLTSGIPGDLVECGVWRGGAAFLMAGLLRDAGARDRKVWMFDSFEGLPPPEEIDGERAMAFARDTASPRYLDNCLATLEDAQRSAGDLGLGAHTEIVKGWFEETLPAHRERIGPIAILRIDSDWHASVRFCLEHLYDQVVEGGFVVIDDYHAYDGCARAVHEFLAERGLAHRIEAAAAAGASPYHQAVVLRKGGPPWRWAHERYLVGQEIAALVPPGRAFVLVDDDELGPDLAEGRRALRFLEGEETSWGPPATDEAALAELERLRGLGARHVAFAWPAFWWLDHYLGLRRHLRSSFRRVLESPRLVAFEADP